MEHLENLVGMAIFARVAEAKSFSGAARRLGISKSAVSKHVARLERELKARLLNRTTRRLSLTDVGTTFYQHCARVVQEAEAAEVAVSRLGSAPSGVLKVTAPAAFGRMHVACAVPDFLARYPDIKLEMDLIDRGTDLAEEGIDVAIHLFGDLAPNTVARKLAPIRWVVCASPQYLKKHGTPQSLDALAGYNCLFYSFRQMQSDWKFRAPDGSVVSVRVGGNFIATNSLAIREVVLRDVGIAMSPTFVVGDDLRAGTLKALFTDYEALGTFGSHINAVYLPNRYLSPKVRAFVDFFVDRFGPQPYWDQGLALAGAADAGMPAAMAAAPGEGAAIDVAVAPVRRAGARRTKAA
ncbi:MAG: LysR family transcriptional regulator [Burkholderiales bacterium]|nr:LysR family transcriptional regulator [Burkholderiales bacterium]